MARILYFVTEDWYFCSHRLSLAVAAKSAGHSVTVVTRVQSHGDVIRASGLDLVPMELSRRGRNVFAEIGLLVRLVKTYRIHRPDIVHHVAIKPVVYGSVAAWIAGAPRTVNAIAGLGYVFSSKDVRARVLRPLLKSAFRVLFGRGRGRVIVQNPDDRAMLVDLKLVNQQRIVLIRGSGVDVKEFCVTPEPAGIPLVVLPARLLWDKGVAEFVAAAKMLRNSGVRARFALVGEPDQENPGTVPLDQLRSWDSDGFVEWWGRRDDMALVYAESAIVCLPTSYGEGLPKSLLEAAACGRPIVATDAPGCREIVRHEDNGLLVPVRDVKALAAALARLIDEAALRARMGLRGRELVEAEFTVERVIQQTLAVYEELLA